MRQFKKKKKERGAGARSRKGTLAVSEIFIVCACRKRFFQAEDSGPQTGIVDDKPHDHSHMAVQMPELRQDQRKSAILTIFGVLQQSVIRQLCRIASYFSLNIRKIVRDLRPGKRFLGDRVQIVQILLMDGRLLKICIAGIDIPQIQ